MSVRLDTTGTPVPRLSLRYRPLSHSRTLGVGRGRRLRVPGQRREREESTGPKESSPEAGAHSLLPLGAVRERERGETSDGAS